MLALSTMAQVPRPVRWMVRFVPCYVLSSHSRRVHVYVAPFKSLPFSRLP
jgi:hypothetical protein